MVVQTNSINWIGLAQAAQLLVQLGQLAILVAGQSTLIAHFDLVAFAAPSIALDVALRAGILFFHHRLERAR